MPTITPQPWTFYSGLWHQAAEAIPPSGITITGTGFGAGPSVVIFENWGDASLGAADTSQWDPDPYGSAYPTVYDGFSGIRGIGNREGGTNEAVDNRKSGFTKEMAPFQDFFVAFDMCVPEGRHFSGASAPNTLPPSSNLKMDWTSDAALDDLTKADLCSFSRTSTSTLTVDGNQSPHATYVTSAFDFDRWNHYQLTRKAGQPDPFVDTGLTEVVITTSVGTYTKNETDKVTFGGGATAAQYTHINFPGWTGNGSQDLTQHLFSYYYRAHGDNCGKRVEVFNNAVYANATARRVIKCDSWSDTEIISTPPAWMVAGMTHWAVIDDGNVIASGVI